MSSFKALSVRSIQFWDPNRLSYKFQLLRLKALRYKDPNTVKRQLFYFSTRFCIQNQNVVISWIELLFFRIQKAIKIWSRNNLFKIIDYISFIDWLECNITNRILWLISTYNTDVVWFVLYSLLSSICYFLLRNTLRSCFLPPRICYKTSKCKKIYIHLIIYLYLITDLVTMLRNYSCSKNCSSIIIIKQPRIKLIIDFFHTSKYR